MMYPKANVPCISVIWVSELENLVFVNVIFGSQILSHIIVLKYVYDHIKTILGILV